MKIRYESLFNLLILLRTGLLEQQGALKGGLVRTEVQTVLELMWSIIYYSAKGYLG